MRPPTAGSPRGRPCPAPAAATPAGGAPRRQAPGATVPQLWCVRGRLMAALEPGQGHGHGTEAVAALLGMDDEIESELVAPHFPYSSVGHQGAVGHNPFPSKIAEPASGAACILALPHW